MEQFTINPLILPAVLVILPVLLNTLNTNIIPSSWQLLNESFYRTILNMIVSTTSDSRPNNYSIFIFPLLITVFYLIFISNYIGLIPYSTTASTEIIITLTLAITLLIGLFILAIFYHGPAQVVHIFLPAGTPLFLLPLMIPLEILAYFTRTLSLGLRQAVNLITGHILVKVLLSFIPSVMDSFFILSSLVLFLTIFLALEILIAYLQAYIFLFITIITLKDLQ